MLLVLLSREGKKQKLGGLAIFQKRIFVRLQVNIPLTFYNIFEHSLFLARNMTASKNIRIGNIYDD